VAPNPPNTTGFVEKGDDEVVVVDEKSDFLGSEVSLAPDPESDLLIFRRLSVYLLNTWARFTELSLSVAPWSLSIKFLFRSESSRLSAALFDVEVRDDGAVVGLKEGVLSLPFKVVVVVVVVEVVFVLGNDVKVVFVSLKVDDPESLVAKPVKAGVDVEVLSPNPVNEEEEGLSPNRLGVEESAGLSPKLVNGDDFA